MIKKYTQFINEAEEVQKEVDTAEKNDTDESKSSKFTDVREQLKEMIEKTIDNSGGSYDDFLTKFIKNPTDVKIEGLTNDSDIYEFYLKWRNDIDEILNEVNFFDEPPSETNSFGLYEFLIKGTEKAVLEFLKIK